MMMRLEGGGGEMQVVTDGGAVLCDVLEEHELALIVYFLNSFPGNGRLLFVC